MYWGRIPLFLYIVAGAGLSMLPPALMAWVENDLGAAKPFMIGALIMVTLSLLTALAMNNRAGPNPARSNLLGLLGAFTVLPLFLGWSLMQVAPGLSPVDAYLEMTSVVTTTGMTLEPEVGAWSRPVHLWRAEVAWLSGLLIWVAALAVLAPLRIGGFELLLPARQRTRQASRMLGDRAVTESQRLARNFVTLGQVYVGLTAALWLLLMISGDLPFVALCHAMSVIATSGISPVGGLPGGTSGFAGEVVVMGFFLFAVTRRSFSDNLRGLRQIPLYKEPELRVAIAAVGLVTAVLFIRHWYALVETAEIIGIGLIPRALWGAIFTSASFLTTTGFASSEWELARLWAGLSTPGMVLMGLALIGGGVATTAGGVKLLRIYVLYKHGQQEVSRLVHPSSVGGFGIRKGAIRTETAFLAWLSFMLVALSITASMFALSLAGQSFEEATILTIAAISNTGPVVDYAATLPLDVGARSEAVKLILCGAMVLGRLETLAFIALFNPDFWRR